MCKEANNENDYSKVVKNKEQIKIIIGVIEKIMSILTKNNKKIKKIFLLFFI